jgi:probable F420-dependent oxidoreductase
VTPRPFRFGVTGGRQTRQEWLDLARKTDDLGYSTLLLPDHFGPQLAPLPALLAAATATPRLRVGTIVLDNDFRHPALLAKEAATIDLMTDGRFELGIGAGWMEADYRVSGLPFDPAGVRVARLTEAVQIIKAFFADDGPVTFHGKYYRVDNLQPGPRPSQRPPLLIAGTRRRMLTLAAREADIVGLEDHQFADRATGSVAVAVAECAQSSSMSSPLAPSSPTSVSPPSTIWRLSWSCDPTRLWSRRRSWSAASTRSSSNSRPVASAWASRT